MLEQYTIKTEEYNIIIMLSTISIPSVQLHMFVYDIVYF